MYGHSGQLSKWAAGGARAGRTPLTPHTGRVTLLRPTRPVAVGTVVLLHGFTRSPRHLDLLSAGCVAAGARTLRPALGSLWWPTSTNNAAHLDRVAAAVRTRSPRPGGRRRAFGRCGGGRVDRRRAARRPAWPSAARHGRRRREPHRPHPSRLAAAGGIAVRAVCAPPSRCNRQGALAAWLADPTTARRRRCDVLPGSGHGDIEGPSQAIYRWACGDDVAAGPRARCCRS